MKTSLFDQLNFHPYSWILILWLRLELCLLLLETALTKVSRTAWATSHHPAGKMIMCCLARLVMKAGVIRRCFCLLLLLLRSHLGHSSRAMGQALSRLGSRVPTSSLCRTGKQLTLAKLLLLPLLLLPVFTRSDWHWSAGICHGHIRSPSQSLRRVVWLPGRADVTALPVFCLSLLGQSDIDPPQWVMVTPSFGSVTPGLAFPSTKNFKFLLASTGSSSGIWCAGKGSCSNCLHKGVVLFEV